jgi:vesicular inhibitory amino acid transporter
MGIVGYLMFGNAVSDEITRDLANTKGYPRVLNKVALWLILINPLSKFALAARPINATLELILGVEDSQINRPPIHTTPSSTAAAGRDISKAPLVAEAAVEVAASRGNKQTDGDAVIDQHGTPRPGASSSAFDSGLTEHANQQYPEQSPLAGSAISLRAAQRTAGWSKKKKLMARAGVQVIIALLIGLTAIVLPGFEKVMAFLGAFLACVTCIFGPLLANLRLLHHEMTRFNIILDVIILFLFSIIATLGTVWSFLPLK